jgi:23S rRNA (uracil1939-C5)-methyltransferase
MKPRKTYPVLESIEIIDAGAEGKCIAKVNDMVVFVPFVVPGDIVDIELYKKKRNFGEGNAIRFHKYSEKRVDAFCEHFGVCGGCRWQGMNYKWQGFYKEKQVTDAFKHIGKVTPEETLPIILSERIQYYRNKLDFAFSSKRWFTYNEPRLEADDPENNALGFHVPERFDKVLNIRNCYLQDELSNQIRLEIKRYALEHEISFYDARNWDGMLRNLIIRNSIENDWLILLVFKEDIPEVIIPMMEHIRQQFPQITSLYYAINNKRNDTLQDVEIRLFSGKPDMLETLPRFNNPAEKLKFKVSPVSFYQTNSRQAAKLYHVAAEFAALTGNEVVYDLYTGTGTIACYVAENAQKVVGIEYVEPAVADARINAAENGYNNMVFYAGDMAKVLTEEFIAANGKPDVIITDPPRAGMHDKVIAQILACAPQRIVYVSCNPATQARDVALLSTDYRLAKIQPVDMFPHTHHVENVALLIQK